MDKTAYKLFVEKPKYLFTPQRTQSLRRRKKSSYLCIFSTKINKLSYAHNESNHLNSKNFKDIIFLHSYREFHFIEFRVILILHSSIVI